MARFKFIVPTLIILFSFLPLINAQSYFSPSIGDAFRLSESGRITDARALSMGNAHTVLSDNYSATILNPATLGLSRHFTVSTSIGTNLYNNNARFISDSTQSSKYETVLTQAGMIIPLLGDSAKNNLVISLGYNHSQDFNRVLKFSDFNSSSNSLVADLTSENNWIPRNLLLSYSTFDPGTNEYLGDKTILNGMMSQEGYVLQEGGVNHWSFGLAYEFAGNIFFGASVNYNVGSFLSDGEFTESDSRNLYADSLRTVPSNPLTIGFQKFYLNDVVDWTYNGVDFRFGVLYKFFNFISIGGSVKTPTLFFVEESHYFHGESDFISGNRAIIDTVINNKFDIASPYEFTAGAMVNLWILTASAEATYIDYTQMKYSGGISVPQASALNKQILDVFTQVVNVRAGAEFRLPFTGLSARAGFMYTPSPVADDPFEFDKKFLTAGLGIKSGEGAMEFNVAYVYGWWDQVAEDYGSSIPQIYQTITSQNIIASLVLRVE